MHYEALLGYVQTQQRRTLTFQQEYHLVFAFLASTVYLILRIRHAKNALYIDQSLRCFDGMLALAEANMPLWVFSLNHDVLIECLALKGGVDLTQGFTECASYPLRNDAGVEIGRLRIELLREAVFAEQGHAFFGYGQQGINLLKVHGGLDLFTTRDGMDLVRILPPVATSMGPILALELANTGLAYIDRASGVRARAGDEIAFEDDGGEMQFLRPSLVTGAFKFESHSEQVLPKSYLDIFASYANHVSTLYCVGYGFGDIHINGVLRNWLELSADRRMKIVSPGAAMPASLLHLAPQIELVNLPASDFFEQFATSPLTDEERQMKTERASHRHEV